MKPFFSGLPDWAALFTTLGAIHRVFICCLLSLFGLRASAGRSTDSVKVGTHSPLIRYEGRIRFSGDSIAELYWPGSSISIDFRGTAISVWLAEQAKMNEYALLVDNHPVTLLETRSGMNQYRLASGLSNRRHHLVLFRRTGWTGVSTFAGFILPPGSEALAPRREAKRRIEFYGNSITVGSGMYPNGHEGGEEDNYNSYAAVTARHYNAHYSCIARSGIGLTVSWFPMTMPQLYGRLNPYDSASVWDFASAVPDVVVVNLFQNDFSIIGDTASREFKARFGDTIPSAAFLVTSYRNFILTLREFYPNAYIICVLGNMDAVQPGSPFPGYIRDAVAGLSDKKVLTHFFAYKKTPGHPNPAEHLDMAQSLIRFIDKHIKW